MSAPTVHRPATGRRPHLRAMGRRPTPRFWRLAAAIITAAVLAAAVALTEGSAPNDPPAVTPLRVTSGSEIATGFAVARDRVVTVAHVVDGADKEGEVDADIRVSGIPARVLRMDPRADLALLAVSGISARAPGVTAAGAGDEVRILRLRNRRRSSLSIHVRRAIVAYVRARGAGRAVSRPALELAARVQAGDSGAPVLARSGALAGVIFAVSSRRRNTAYAVDAGAVTRLLARD
jgi:S1-C subfamily serine protease